MRIKIVYISDLYIRGKLKVKLNKEPAVDLDFDRPGEVFLENSQVFKEKKNVLRFRHVSPDEKEEQRRSIISNILRGFLFFIMAVILPCAVMNFKRVKIPFSKLKFEYKDGHDFVLYMSPTESGYAYESTKEKDPNDPFTLGGGLNL